MKDYSHPGLNGSLFPAGKISVWKRFVDPVHWAEAERRFPDAPWKFYLKPDGQNIPEQWGWFQEAFEYVCRSAAEAASGRRALLTVNDILNLNAWVMTGDRTAGAQALRNNRPIFNCRTSAEIKRVYRKGSVFYTNEDGLHLRVDGFWPIDRLSIDFFAACRTLSASNYQNQPEQWEEAYLKFQGMLYPQICAGHETWQVYFLTRREDLIAQLTRILQWFESQVAEIEGIRKENLKQRKAVELAVKMQRYIDICQFCMDGSGRTSKLVQDYILCYFGYPLTDPVLYEAYGRPWENGTYLPLDEAVRMAARRIPDESRVTSC